MKNNTLATVPVTEDTPRKPNAPEIIETTSKIIASSSIIRPFYWIAVEDDLNNKYHAGSRGRIQLCFYTSV